MPPKKLPPKEAPSAKPPAQKLPPKKLPPRTPQETTPPQKPPPQKLAPKPQQKPPPPPLNQASSRAKSNGTAPASQLAIPEQQVKQSSSTSAQLALEAGKKAYELRQAAHGAGDPNAREEILAKAINKEIEAESFGKAAKYTRSGAFQGLAAGAGLGVQPGVTLGKVTGAIVGGLVSSVGALLGGGVGSVYGSISGPMWDLGQMASQGVRSIVGDFPNWEATPGQKKTLEKMVLGAQQTKAPSQDELEQMRDDNGGGTLEEYQRFATDLTSCLPSMPSMPSKSSLPSMPSMSSIPGLGGQSKHNTMPAARNATPARTAPNQNKQPRASANSQTASKPSATSPKATNQASKTQPPPKVSENAARNKPKKLEVRSRNGASQRSHAAV